MSEANAPFDSSPQPESNRSSQPLEVTSDPAGLGRPKAFSELKTLTDLTETDLAETELTGLTDSTEAALPDLESASPASPSSPSARSIWHNVRQNTRQNTRQTAQSTDPSPAPSGSQDEIEFDISRIFDASDLDGLAFEGEANGLPAASAELSLADLWPATGSQVAPEPTQFASGKPKVEPKAADPEPVKPEPVKPEPASLQEISSVAVPATSPAVIGAAAGRSEQGDSTPEAGSELPSLVDLIGLIQELNQCNGVLIDRVSQLEEALEYSQSALQAEVGRIHDSELGQDWSNSQDWATVQDQVANLFNQLEFAHQTNQRQQILIETLTGQLENSQERVAQLEREAALIQQRYDEQAQLLLKSEHTNRDLQARLQRQQRYTLQFKVALEKSLEVATPPYEVGLYEAKPQAAEDVLLLPKAKQIQPWSAQSQMPLNQSAWMKLQSLPLAVSESEPAPSQDDAAAIAPRLEAIRPAAQPLETVAQPAEQAATHLKLPDFGMPLLQFESTDKLAAPESPASIADPTADSSLKQQLEEVVKPLADMLAEAMLAGSPLPQETHSAPPAPPAPSANSASAGPAAEPAAPAQQQTDQLLASVMADAEDALWQDLARLIDVSTEDVVKASLSGDLAAFESIDFAALNASSTSQPPEAAPTSDAVAFGPESPVLKSPAPELPAPESPQPQPTEQAAAIASLLRRQTQAQNQVQNQAQNQAQSQTSSAAAEAAKATADEESADVPAAETDQTALAPSSWPSPVVYPLRPVKKRQSLAMVDLPTFPRPQESI